MGRGRVVRGLGCIGSVAVLCAGAMMSASAAGAADMVTKAPLASSQQPAVDGINGKYDVFGGSLAEHGYFAGTGSLSVPVANQFGVQFDGLAGSYRNAFLGAIGAHAFWRNPSTGLFGIYGSYAHLDRLGGLEVGRFGTEGAIYLARVTLEGMIGVESGNSQSARVGNLIETVDIKTRFFDRIDVAYYATDDLKFSIGHRYTGGKSQLALGSEWAFGSYGNNLAALFVEGRVGGHENSSVWAGLRMYVGQKVKSLIRRHREDDPVNGLGDDTSTFGNAGGTTPVPVVSTGGGGL